VGKDGTLQPGDELLEVNGKKLVGLNHTDVVAILKDLPQNVKIVCARARVDSSRVHLFSNVPERLLSTSNNDNDDAFDGSSSVSSSLGERLVKAKSEGSIASSPQSVVEECNGSLSSVTRMKSRSLEPLNGVALWSPETQVIELTKGERGLGFSILDYQDPLSPNDTVILIRSLVPGGVAQQDGRLIPGDRLVFVRSENR
jgi:hypothetical protein